MLVVSSFPGGNFCQSYGSSSWDDFQHRASAPTKDVVGTIVLDEASRSLVKVVSCRDNFFGHDRCVTCVCCWLASRVSSQDISRNSMHFLEERLQNSTQPKG